VKPADLPGEALGTAGCQADIEFAREPGGRTYIARQRVGYPFHLGKALHLPGDPVEMPTVYLQSCSGGIFEADRLALQITARAGSQARVTTAASTIVHSMEHTAARQTVFLQAELGALLEYLPEPTILFPQARFGSHLRVTVHPEAAVIFGDSLIFHDPAGRQDWFSTLDSDTRIFDGTGELMVGDRFCLKGEDLARGRPGINGTWGAQGSFFAVTARDVAQSLVAALREGLSSLSGVYAAASALPHGAGAWARILAHDGASLRAAMQGCRRAARNVLSGHHPRERRP
jgi:urease accessory protein